MTHILKTNRANLFLAVALLASFAIISSSPAQAKASAQSIAKSQEADLRLELNKVNLLAESGKTGEAYDLLDKLKAKYPDNAQVAAAEADLRGRSNYSDAMSDLCLPSTLVARGQDLLERERMMSVTSRGGFACGGYNRRITPEAYEQITNIGGQVGLGTPNVALYVDLQNDHLNTRAPFARANETEQSYYGSRHQGTVMLRKTFNNGDVGGVSVYGNDRVPGAGLQYAFKDRWGATGIQANYNQPNWDYVASVVQHGTKDNIYIERRQNFSPNLTAMIRGGYNHYSLDNLWGAADAPGWNLNVDYSRAVNLFDQAPDALTGWNRGEVIFGAHYAVDAEYFTYVARRQDRSGADPFHPLPATSYEVHSFTVSAAKSILPNVNAQIEGGYGVNRWNGGHGPVYAGSIIYTPIKNLGIDLHASRNLLGGQNEGEKEEIIGSNIKWAW